MRNELYFCENQNIATIKNPQVILFLEKTNAMYTALISMFSHKQNQIHREIIAREFTRTLSEYYPDWINGLKESL